MKIGLISRVKDEYFISEFIHYYLNQGVDVVHIIDDNSTDKSVYDPWLNSPNVVLHFQKDIITTNYASKLYKEIGRKYDWLLYLDADEFITTKKNPSKTIREELETTFKDVDCVKVPWVMMSCNGLEKSPPNILETVVHRWNHDLRHINKINKHQKFSCRYDKTGVKCLFKPSKFSDLWDHHPLLPVDTKNSIVRDGVFNNPSELNPFYHNLRESHIEEGYLLCYHYRIISVENCIQKLKTNIWYTNDNFTLEDLMSIDYAEILDESIKLKTEWMRN